MRALAAFACLMLVTACQTPPPAEMTEAERADIQAAVLDWSDQWLEAGTNLDAQGVAALMDQADAHLVNGTVYRATWADFLAGSEELYAGWVEWGGVWDNRRVDVLGPGVALLVGQATGPLELVDGRMFTNRARFSFVVREIDGEWRGLYGHISGAWTPRE